MLVLLSASLISACNYTTHRTFSRTSTDTTYEVDADPDYSISLDPTYQDFVNYMYMGNRSDNFATYFNSFYLATEDFKDALKIYRTSTVATYNKRLDSINITPVLTQDIRDKLTKVIERASKIIQLHKNSRFLDDAVLLVGKTYYYLTDYLKAERQLDEFLSNLQPSPLYDEAILYLGMTKIKLGKTDEGEKILKNVLATATDRETRSEAAQQLGINEYSKKNYNEAISYFRTSIDVSGDNESKAIKQFILAKMYSIIDPAKSAREFQNVNNYTSDYDQTFYSRLNSAKGYNYLRQYQQSLNELGDLRKKYRESPEYKQLVELEIANTYFYQKRYRDAIYAYYDVIIDYPATSAAADAYYYLGKYYETDKNNYLSAATYYIKATTESTGGDFYEDANKKASSFEKYYTLLGLINGTSKIDIPETDLYLEKYRLQKNEEKGIKVDKSNEPNHNGSPPRDNGKGSGTSSKFTSDLRDSMINNLPPNSQNLFKTPNETDPDFARDSSAVDPQFQPTQNFPIKFKDDTLKAPVSSVKNDSLIKDPLAYINDSLKVLADKRYAAYYELAELFLYELQRKDSAEFYLNTIIQHFFEPEKNSKALYALATLYQKDNNPERARELFQKVINDYPNTVFANESRKSLGIKTVEVEEETVKELYKNAERALLAGRNYEALTLLNELYIAYPGSSIAPKIIYTQGWIYENNLMNRDSAIIMYRQLKLKFPNSEYSAAISPKLELLNTSKISSDSTKKTLIATDTTVVLTDSLGNEIKKTELPPDKIDNGNLNDKDEKEKENIKKEPDLPVDSELKKDDDPIETPK
ncbi:hypothetical protein BH10BAC5_BH10BAC5_20930 [soil metagenome]